MNRISIFSAYEPNTQRHNDVNFLELRGRVEMSCNSHAVTPLTSISASGMYLSVAGHCFNVHTNLAKESIVDAARASASTVAWTAAQSAADATPLNPWLTPEGDTV